MANKRLAQDLNAALAAARADLEAARNQIAVMASEEAAAVADSDSAFATWLRRKRLADNDVARLIELVSKLEADIVSEQVNAELARYAARYQAVANRNREVAELYRSELPRAWQIISAVLEAAAAAKIETEAIIRQMPANFKPGVWIGDPELMIRVRPPLNEEVISSREVELWVDAESGDAFANQSARPSVAAKKKFFREVQYHPSRPSNDPGPFWRNLKMPRLDALGPPVLFDGSNIHTPSDVLKALRQPRARSEGKRPVLTTVEPVDPPKKSVEYVVDQGPPIAD